jgi:CobQ-like glutamine amidotransferase family enzyme
MNQQNEVIGTYRHGYILDRNDSVVGTYHNGFYQMKK